MFATFHLSGMANWCSLPEDLWMLIAKKFSLLRDLNLFASVCVKWRCVAKAIRGDFMSRPPLLMLPLKKETHASNFYDLSTNSSYSINLPELTNRWICGASNGWLVTLDNNLNSELINPYSKEKLQLPEHMTKYLFNTYRSNYMRKVILTESPNSDKECFVVAIVSLQLKLAICRVGDDKWTDIMTAIETDIEMEPNQYLDVTCYKGKIFAIRDEGPLVLVDVGQGFKITTVNAPEHPRIRKEIVRQKYLVESGGHLLLVLRVTRAKRKYFAFKTYMFHVYKLNESMTGWTKVENLGNWSIFIGGNHSMSAVVCGLDGYRSNCIYYLENRIINSTTSGCQYDCGLFCLEDGRTEPLPEEVLSFWCEPGFWCMQSL